ncbi:MAG: methyltransferase domain-containing protein [Spirochaetes bacterium]|nr:methyltransferase domain-containing protein [Spirochaetota bacterium]
MFDFLFPDLKKRSFIPEMMDLPDCDKKKLINTVKQFAMLNYLFTKSRELIKRYILSTIRSNPLKEYTFLDIGAGGCDVVIWLLNYCKKKNYKIKISCLDNDPAIINYAQNRCKKYEAISIINESAFSLDKLQNYDFIFANHFLHHLKDEEILKMIRLIKKKTNILFLINDIRRSNLAYLGYTLFTGVFYHNSFAFYDGRLSIRKGFTQKELEALIDDESVEVNRVNPARILLIGYK